MYQLMTGQVLYSETAREDSDSYVFNGDQTLVVIVNMKSKGQADIQMIKASGSEFAPKQMRILKTAIMMIQDCGRPELVAKAKEALSGLSIVGGVN